MHAALQRKGYAYTEMLEGLSCAKHYFQLPQTEVMAGIHKASKREFETLPGSEYTLRRRIAVSTHWNIAFIYISHPLWQKYRQSRNRCELEQRENEAKEWILYILFKLHHLLRTHQISGIYSLPRTRYDRVIPTLLDPLSKLKML